MDYEANLLKDLDILKRLTEDDHVVGWIDPDGNIFIIDLYSHIEFLSKRFPEINDIWNSWQEEKAETYQEFYDSIPEDEHPCWHNYEMWEYGAEDAAKQKIYNTAYAAGWVRFGTFDHKGIKMIEFDTDSVYKEMYKIIHTNFAEVLGRYIPLRKHKNHT
jgi:hypothetical protein